MKVLIFKPGEPGRIEERDSLTLEDEQEIVDGPIELAYPPSHDDDAAVVCNEEGKLRGLPYNRYLCYEDGVPYDIVCGTFFIVRAPEDEEDFKGLTDEQVEKYLALYRECLNV